MIVQKWLDFILILGGTDVRLIYADLYFLHVSISYITITPLFEKKDEMTTI